MLSVYSFCSCIFSLADILSHPRLPDETYRLLNLGKRQWEPHRPCELPEGIYGSVPVKRSGRFLPRWCTISGALIWNLNVTAWKRCSAAAWYNNSYIMLVKNCRIYLSTNKAIFLFLFQVRMRSTGWRTAGLLFLWMATMSGLSSGCDWELWELWLTKHHSGGSQVYSLIGITGLGILTCEWGLLYHFGAVFMFVEGDDHRFTRAVPQFYLQRRGGNMIQSRPSNYYLLEALTSSYKNLLCDYTGIRHQRSSCLVWCNQWPSRTRRGSTKIYTVNVLCSNPRLLLVNRITMHKVTHRVHSSIESWERERNELYWQEFNLCEFLHRLPN